MLTDTCIPSQLTRIKSKLFSRRQTGGKETNKPYKGQLQFENVQQ